MKFMGRLWDFNRALCRNNGRRRDGGVRGYRDFDLWGWFVKLFCLKGIFMCCIKVIDGVIKGSCDMYV